VKSGNGVHSGEKYKGGCGGSGWGGNERASRVVNKKEKETRRCPRNDGRDRRWENGSCLPGTRPRAY